MPLSWASRLGDPLWSSRFSRVDCQL
jgi:hypothetical protein